MDDDTMRRRSQEVTDQKVLEIEKQLESIAAFPHNPNVCDPGLSKRELYATVAMHAMVSRTPLETLNVDQIRQVLRAIPGHAAVVADNMCKQAEKNA